jgi:hypothetical protein
MLMQGVCHCHGFKKKGLSSEQVLTLIGEVDFSRRNVTLDGCHYHNLLAILLECVNSDQVRFTIPEPEVRARVPPLD